MKKQKTLRLKSANSIRFSRKDIKAFAAEIVLRSKKFFTAAKQTPFFVVPRLADPKVQRRLERAVVKAFDSKVTFSSALARDGFAVALNLRLVGANCGQCGETYRRLLTTFAYFAQGADISTKVERVLDKHGLIVSQVWVCEKCGNPDQQEEKGPVEGPATHVSRHNPRSGGPLSDDLSLLGQLSEF